MNIIVNGRCLSDKRSGIEEYTYQLCKGIADEKISLEIHTLSPIQKYYNFSDEVLIKEKKKRTMSGYQKALWDGLYIEQSIPLYADILHSPNITLPLINSKKMANIQKVITVHDIIFLKHPEWYDRKTILYYKLFFNASIKKADKIICVSKSTAVDLINLYPSCIKKIHIIPNAARNILLLKDHKPKFLIKRTQPFILLIGGWHIRKNIKRTIESFNKSKSAKVFQLVIVGSTTEELIRQYQSKSVYFTQYIPDEHLNYLYKNCEGMIFTSLYEGFGIPILEAMSCGKKVLTSANSAMIEISGYDKEFLCNPYDEKDIIEKIDILFLENAHNSNLIEHSKKQFLNYSWKKTAEMTINCYNC